MPDTSHNILSEPLIGARLSPGTKTLLTLPEVLAELSKTTIEAFTHLRPHQSHAWHAFLVQLAAITMFQTDSADLPSTADAWREGLLGLTSGEAAPWCLFVKDLARPAFLQPPVPEGSLAAFKNRLETPDELDVLITAKNHDLKASRILHPKADHWLYALLTLQTTEGFLGAGNYGIARMNGGFSSRPCVTLAPGLDAGARFRRDVEILLDSREQLLEKFAFQEEGGLALLWSLPWDGTSPVGLAQCDPFFIEICRRIRLVEAAGNLTALATPTKERRVQAEQSKGNVGDAWTPIIKKDPETALTVSASGFNYKLMQDLFFGPDYTQPTTQKLRASDEGDFDFYAWVLVRGQGKTEGLHERRIPIPKKFKRNLRSAEGKADLGSLAKQQVDTAAKVQRFVLKPALCALTQPGAAKLDFSDDRPRRWLDGFDQAVDREFFGSLWENVEHPDADQRWQQRVARLAEDQLQRAIASTPFPDVSRYKAIAAAEGLFHGLKRKHLSAFAPHAERTAE